MPKLKSKSSAKKRFQLTASGLVKRKHAFKNHILTKKKKDRKRRLVHSAIVSEVDTPRIKEMLVA